MKITQKLIKHLVLLTGIFICFTTYAQEVGIDNSVYIGKLDNGLRYYIQHNEKPSKKLELRLVINAGSLQETDAQRGLAHFTEHMMFNGTKSYPKNDLVDRLESMGIAFGADLNAYTSFDETVYILPIPTENRANVEEGFKILKEWAGDALLTDSDIDAERTVILEENRLNKGVDRRMYEKFFPNLFNHTLYAYRLPIGLEKVIKEAPYQEFRDFYKTWYRPNLMAVVAVGDITVAEGEALIKKYFSTLTNPEEIAERKDITATKYAENDVMILTDQEATNYSATFYFSPLKVDRPNSVQTYRANILQALFASALNRRLGALKEQANPPFASAFIGIDGYMRGYEGTIVGVSPTTDMNLAIKTVMTEMNRMAAHGITEQELATGKKMLLASAENQLKEKDATNSSYFVGQYVNHFLNGTPAEGQELKYDYYSKMLPSITVAEVNKEIKKWLDVNNTFFGTITGPDSGKIEMPAKKEVLKDIKEALTTEVLAHQAKAESESLVDLAALQAQKGNIISETYDEALDVTYYELSNGVKVALKTTDFKNDEIVMVADNYGGNSLFNTTASQNKENAFFASNMLDVLGYGEFTPSELKTFLAGKSVSVNLSMDKTSSTVSASSTVKDVETMMQLLYLKMNGLRKDEQLFQSTINTFKTQLSMLSKDPNTAFVDTLVKVLYKNSPLSPVVVPNEAMMSKMNLDEVYKIYEASFKNAASDFYYVFTGNIDKEVFKNYLELYLGALAPSAQKNHWVDNGLRPVQGFNDFVYHKGVEEKALILQFTHGKIDYSQDLELKAQMLGEILNFKIIEEVREKLGAIYGGGFNVDVRKVPYPYYQIALQLPCGPDNVDTILKTVNLELKKIRQEGVSEKDLEKVKAIYTEKFRTSLESNSAWAQRILMFNRWDYDKERFLHYNEILDKVSNNDIKAVANLLFAGVNSNIFLGTLYPENYEKK